MIGLVDLVFLIIFLLSFLGIIIIILQKIPVLVQLPDTEQKSVFANLSQKIKNNFKKIKDFTKEFSFEVFFQKILSKIRVLNLKLENKITHWLQSLREKNKKKKEGDNYWQELKKNAKK